MALILAHALPLSLPLGRLEESLQASGLEPGLQQLLLVLASLALALAVGTLTCLALGWALGPGWASSLGLIAAYRAATPAIIPRLPWLDWRAP
ncbi:MAG: hypothetical protein ACKOPS_21460 [Cyanobium sp.]